MIIGDSSDGRASLTRLPPRSAQLLMFRFVDGRSPAECMALYGIDPDALEIHLLRAADLLWEASTQPDGECNPWKSPKAKKRRPPARTTLMIHCDFR